jgi:DNA-binding NarL/FixJ family response regulator
MHWESAAKAPASTRPTRRRLRVLVAEPRPAVRDAIAARLETRGFDVIAIADDGVDAVDLLLAHEPAVAVVGAELPRLSGRGVADVAAAYAPGTAVLLCAPEDDPDAMAAVVAEIAPRPRLESRELQPVVRAALAGAGDDATFVVDAALELVYYDSRWADWAGLPFPPRPLAPAELRAVLDRLSPPGVPQRRPLFRALRTRQPAEWVTLNRWGAELLITSARARPLFDDGRLVGVATHWRLLERFRSREARGRTRGAPPGLPQRPGPRASRRRRRRRAPRRRPRAPGSRSRSPRRAARRYARACARRGRRGRGRPRRARPSSR